MREESGMKKSDRKRGGDWRQFLGFFKKVKLSWRWILLALAVSIAYYAAVSFVPGSTAALYAGDFGMAAIMGLVLNYVCTLVLSLVTSISRLIAESKSVRSVRNSVWKRMIGVKAEYYDEHDPGRLLSAVTSDAETTVTSLIAVIIMIPSLIMYLVMCLAQISMYNRKLLAVLFVLVPAYIAYGFFMGRWMFGTGRAVQMRIGGLTGFLTERIRNLLLIKSFAAEKKEVEKGVAAAEGLYKANVQYQYITGVQVAFTFVTEAVGIVTAVLWGCHLLQNGEIDLEAWLAFFLFVPMINTVLRQLAMMWSNIKEVQGRASRMSEIMDAPQEAQNPQVVETVPEGNVVFEKVCFSYVKDKPVLQNMDLVIPHGKTTAIVGVSGSGKTTVLKLLEQLYVPDSGRITIDGTDIRGLNLQSFRNCLSYVTQDAAMFGGTVRECLTYGVHREVRDEEILEAAKKAEIYEYIMAQPDGLETELAIAGRRLSGGQRQRLVIARELLKKADILLMDEPTSALDAETAAAVSNTIFREFQGKTIIMVTHELNFISEADQIIVMNHGRLEGCGTHRELLASCGSYRGLVEEQSYQEVFAQ